MNDFFDASFMQSIVVWIMNSIGYYLILKKCGGKPLLGLIPVVREYRLAFAPTGRKREEPLPFWQVWRSFRRS